jgi:TRAP-type uncharacterized transport system fused permease subunit
VQIERLNYFLLWDSSAVFGTPMQIITTVVVAFVFFGNALFKSGGSVFFTDISMVMMGRFRGGPAKISIMASSLFGTISGSVVANVVTTGVVTIPLMKRGRVSAAACGRDRGGFVHRRPIDAAGHGHRGLSDGRVPASALHHRGAGGADTGRAVLHGAVHPGRPRGRSRRTERHRPNQIPNGWSVLKAGWHFPIPFVVLIGALFWLNYEPETAALLAAAAVIVASVVFGFGGKRLSFDDSRQDPARHRTDGDRPVHDRGCGRRGDRMPELFGPRLLADARPGASVRRQPDRAPVHRGVACIILGMGMPTVGVYILLATLVAPALIEMKIEPMAAHLFILYFGCLSMITPPVAIGAFAAANLAGADPMKTGFEAVRFGWLVFVIPFLFEANGANIAKVRSNISMLRRT